MSEEIPHMIHFILLLAGLFAALVILIFAYHTYKAWRRRRLVSPRKDYVHKQQT